MVLIEVGARPFPRDIFYFGLSHFLDIQHAEYTADALEGHTVVVVAVSTSGFSTEIKLRILLTSDHSQCSAHQGVLVGCFTQIFLGVMASCLSQHLRFSWLQVDTLHFDPPSL